MGKGVGPQGAGRRPRPLLWGGTWRSLNGVRKVGRERRQVQGALSCARCRRHGAEDVVGPIIKKKKIDVRTTQLTIFMILLHSLLRKLLSPNPNQISFSFK